MDLDAAVKALGIRTLIRKVPYLSVQLDDGALSICAHDGPTGVSVLYRNEQWVLETEEWHGHYETAAEALASVKLLLSGQARTAAARRGDRLAATWRETWDGEAFESSNVAYFLNPFDRQEWELWPEESWVVERTSRLAIDENDWRHLGLRNSGKWFSPEDMGNSVIEEAEFSMKPEEWMLNRFDRSLGSPPEGCRWASNSGATFVFPLPLDFRSCETESQPGPKLEVFINQSETRCVRLQVGYREVAGNLKRGPRKENTRPTLVEEFDDPSTRSNAWIGAMWRVYFNDGKDEMLAQVGAYQQEAEDIDFEAFKGDFEKMLRLSVYH